MYRAPGTTGSDGFARSHATAFARLAHETLWLTCHHPLAFYTARLNAQPGGFYPPSVIVGDARRHGVAVLGPDRCPPRARTRSAGGPPSAGVPERA